MNTETNNQTIDPKLIALAKFLECETEELTEESTDSYSWGREEYLVLTDEEADERAREYILDTLWAFNAEFIASHTVDGLEDDAIKALREIQSKLCESANSLIKSMIHDMDHFIEDAISSDGRGHFMSSYDGEENESGEYYIYRTN
jgi:hypothetical protein